MLYPTINFTYPSSNGRYDLPSGNLGFFPLVVPEQTYLNLTMAQIILSELQIPQDQSIRCWISQTKGGANVDYTQQLTWHLTALLHHTIAVYDQALPPPTGFTLAVPVAPGNYWLNALNLVNESNSFALVIA